jgi:ribosomal protein L11 methyltransferase
MSDWLRLTLRVTAESSEAVVAELWSLGTVGIEERIVDGVELVDAFFAPGGAHDPERMKPGNGFWESFGATLERVEKVPDRDWTEPFRRRVRSFPVGRGFQIDPREPEEVEVTRAEGRLVLRIPARRAFGIGSHESTRLVLEWLEDLDLSGRSVLDVGTGTGILAFVALHRGAARLTAVDRDPAAAIAARENQLLNGLAFSVAAATVRALQPSARFDLALVNVLPGNIAEDLEAIRGLLTDRGKALFSGILGSRASWWSGTLEAAGFGVSDRRVDGEWEAWMTGCAGAWPRS